MANRVLAFHAEQARAASSRSRLGAITFRAASRFIRMLGLVDLAHAAGAALPAGPVEVAVTQVGPPETPHLRVSLEGQPFRSPIKAAVTSALERLLGLRIDLNAFYRFAARQGRLGQLARRFRTRIRRSLSL